MRNRFKQLVGFTMIELLVVIAVIGVLSVAVLSAINPIEQINKGRDTGTRSDASELLNAVDRYYATQEEYPWNTSGASYDPTVTDLASAFWYSAAGPKNGAGSNLNWIYNLQNTEEVKQGYVTRVINNNQLYIYKPAGANQTMYACFLPTSKGFQLEAQKGCGSGADSIKASYFCGSNSIASGSNLICLP